MARTWKGHPTLHCNLRSTIHCLWLCQYVRSGVGSQILAGSGRSRFVREVDLLATTDPDLCGLGMLPGIAYYLSRWYTKDELAFRLALYIG